jgi:ABC-type arginine transport system permease subunit
MAIELGCKLLAQCSLTIVLYFLLVSFRFNFFSCGVICSFLAVFFAAYKSRYLLFISAICSGDSAARRALSSSRLRCFEHVTMLSMELDAFTAPMCNKKKYGLHVSSMKDTIIQVYATVSAMTVPIIGWPARAHQYYLSNM